MTTEEQTAITRECHRLAHSPLSEDEQVAAAVAIGRDFGLGPEEVLTQLYIARIYEDPIAHARTRRRGSPALRSSDAVPIVLTA